MAKRKGMALDRAAILAADDLRIERVAVEEWGGSIALRTLPGTELAAWQEANFEGEGVKKGRLAITVAASLVALAVVDEKGARVFTDADIPALEAKNPAVIQRLFKTASRLNGMGVDAAADAEKN